MGDLLCHWGPCGLVETVLAATAVPAPQIADFSEILGLQCNLAETESLKLLGECRLIVGSKWGCGTRSLGGRRCRNSEHSIIELGSWCCLCRSLGANSHSGWSLLRTSSGQGTLCIRR